MTADARDDRLLDMGWDGMDAGCVDEFNSFSPTPFPSHPFGGFPVSRHPAGGGGRWCWPGGC